MSKKRKFKVGQVVFMDEYGFYGKIVGAVLTESGIEYQCQRYPAQEDCETWPGSELRPLTKRERGA